MITKVLRVAFDIVPKITKLFFIMKQCTDRADERDDRFVTVTIMENLELNHHPRKIMIALFTAVILT